MGPCSYTRQAQGEIEKTAILRQSDGLRWAAPRFGSVRAHAARSVGFATFFPMAEVIFVFERSCYSRQAFSRQGATARPKANRCRTSKNPVANEVAGSKADRRCTLRRGHRTPNQSVENVETLGDRLCRNGRNRMPARPARRDTCFHFAFRAKEAADGARYEPAPVWSGRLLRHCFSPTNEIGKSLLDGD